MRTNLQAMRKRAGYKSAKEFAESIGMSENTYRNYEQGVSSLTLEKAWEFADILDCSIDEIAGRDFHTEETDYFVMKLNEKEKDAIVKIARAIGDE